MKSFRIKSSESLNLTYLIKWQKDEGFFCCRVYSSHNYKALSCTAKFSSIEILHYTFLMQCRGAELLIVFLDLCFSTVLTVVFKHNVFCNQFVCMEHSLSA